jgi:phosphatidylserine/phosphatidylglycerophosphate/cardiolipin synthase-like enzyme
VARAVRLLPLFWMMWLSKINKSKPAFSWLTIISSFFFVLVAYSLTAQISILEARQSVLGSTVTVTGIVTSGQEFGNIRYLQDDEAGIAAFPGSGSVPGFATQVQRGDSLVVTGVLVDFNGLLELSPITGFTVISKNNPLPDPIVLALDEVNEFVEGMLVRYQAVRFVETGFFAANSIYTLIDQIGQEQYLYIRSNHPLVGLQIPTGDQDVIGIVSDYNGYQLLPRDAADFIPAGELFFTHLVEQVDLSTTSVSFQWSTNISAEAVIAIEDMDGMIRLDTINSSNITHSYEVQNLSEATPYFIQVFAERPGISVPGNRQMMTTSSSLPGEIEVYFNQSVDFSFSNGPLPITTSGDEILDELLSLIQQATQTVDVCIYNINEAVIVQTLNNVYNKGVQVRFIAAESTSNTALEPPPPFPVIFGNASGLMHNKFVIIDAAIPDKASVFMGSMNFTTPQIFDHPNNMVLFKDPTIAQAYTFEFEEMWGSNSAFPDSAASRFGSYKKNNTAHLFRVGETLVESYFSPSDNTNRQILSEIEAMQSKMDFALLTFTKDDLAEAMADKSGEGKSIRGIIDNINDNGSEYALLLNAGIQVKDHEPSTILHHKYATLDGNRVITGSHNWSNAANQVNDENTIIIHDEAIANLFLQEFEARWAEVSVSLNEFDPEYILIEIASVQPGVLWIKTDVASDKKMQAQVFDMLGRMVQLDHSVTLHSGQTLSSFVLPDLVPGLYNLSLQDVASGHRTVLRFFSAQ